MSRSTPPRQITSLRVRIDECDGTGAITPGRIFALADEARFDLYEALAREGVIVPARHVAKAEQLELLRAPRKRETITVEAWVEAVGRTSYRVGHRLRGEDGAEVAQLVSTLVLIPEPGVDDPMPPSLRACAHDPLAIERDDPGEPDGSVAFLRTLEAWPSDENTGRHLARTRMIDWMNDARRVGAARGAFEQTHPLDEGPLRSLTIVYERECFAGDGLRLAIAASAPGVFEASLVRGKERVARARLRVAPRDASLNAPR